MTRIRDHDGQNARSRSTRISDHDGPEHAADLRVGDKMIELQLALAPAALFSTSLTRRWHHRAGGHEIEIIKVRPLFLAGFRRNAFTIKVDGVVVAETKGV